MYLLIVDDDHVYHGVSERVLGVRIDVPLPRPVLQTLLDQVIVDLSVSDAGRKRHRVLPVVNLPFVVGWFELDLLGILEVVRPEETSRGPLVQLGVVLAGEESDRFDVLVHDRHVECILPCKV